MEAAPKRIIQSATQPADELHKNVGGSLEQLGHNGSTVPPSEGPVIGEDIRGLAEDMTYVASSALEQAVTGGVTNDRVTPGGRLRRWVIDRVSRMKGVLKKK